MNKEFKTEPYIRYANCYEDPKTLLKLVGEKKSVLSIASGGDNCLALLTAPNIKSITIFDKNPAQLCLTKLKFAAFKYLSHKDVLVLLGIIKGDSAAVYNSLRTKLDLDTKNYFDSRLKLISKIKLVNCGKFEYYLKKVRKIAIRLTQNKKNIKRFMNMPTDMQKDFYLNKINNRRWRFVAKRFFSKKTVARLGRDKDFFKYADADLHKAITDRILLCFDNVPNQENTYLQYTVYGRFVKLPFYLQKENFDIIKANIDKALFVLGDVSTVFSLNTNFDFFNLSDIFEYMDKEAAKQNEAMIAFCASQNAVIVFWNMLVDRQFLSEKFLPMCQDKIYQLYKNEEAYYYQALKVYTRT
ncbi:MAG: BtaA family protein [Firmicutes bacterium]|nr:BtaA family protein [Bacillota bacterium]